MTTRDVLVKARELISDPKHWTQMSYARDAKGTPVAVHSTSACRFCAEGAVLRAEGVPGMTLNDPKWAAALDNAAGKDIVSFNDHHTHAEVLAVFDAAIAEVSKAKQ